MLKSFQIRTTAHSTSADITAEVQRIVTESGSGSGLCLVYIPHTTAAVTVNEGADPDVMRDVLHSLEKLVPWSGDYRHSEGNSAAHIKSILVGGSAHIIIEGGKLLLGTWQRIFLFEFDGPRTRTVNVKVLRGTAETR